MKKENIIKKSDEINNVLKNGKKFKNKYFYIYKDRSEYDKYRFALCVSKKIGNAVRRNKVKRQLKDIIDKSNLIFNSYEDYVIIVSREINNITFLEMKESLISLISKI